MQNNLNEIHVYSPLQGKVINVTEVNDPVFSKKMIGDGIAVIPENGEIYSPVDGVLTKVFGTKHAFSFLSDDNLEILLHFGLETVELKGLGFEVYVSSGNKVKKGDLIAKADLDYIKSKGKSLVSPVVVTNLEEFKNIDVFVGNANNSSIIFSVS